MYRKKVMINLRHVVYDMTALCFDPTGNDGPLIPYFYTGNQNTIQKQTWNQYNSDPDVTLFISDIPDRWNLLHDP